MQDSQPLKTETALAERPRSAISLFDGPSVSEGALAAEFTGSEAVQILIDIARGNTKHTKGVKPETQIKAIEQLRLIEEALKPKPAKVIETSLVRQDDGSFVTQDIMDFQEPLPRAPEQPDSRAHPTKPLGENRNV